MIVTDENVPNEQAPAEAPPAEMPEEAPVLAPPIQSRFLFVDVAALRAKQLRRGALPRTKVAPDAATARADLPHKAERVAMEEVRKGLVLYQMPDEKETPEVES
jgi:DNA-directed RNA polymerase subunit K/omega